MGRTELRNHGVLRSSRLEGGALGQLPHNQNNVLATAGRYPSLLRAAEYEKPEQQETRSRADQHRGELSHVAPDERREVRVGHESMRHKPQHYAAYPYAHRCLHAERPYLLGIVAGMVSEGP